MGRQLKDAGGNFQLTSENLAQNTMPIKIPPVYRCYRIARVHQGDMRVESELGKGTKFILQLTGCD